LSTFFPLFFCKKVHITDYHFLENQERRGQKENIEGREKEKKKKKEKKRPSGMSANILSAFFLLSDDKVSVRVRMFVNYFLLFGL
jgi:hypothetical protein